MNQPSSLNAPGTDDTETMVPVYDIKDDLVGWFPFSEVYPSGGPTC